MKSIQELTQDDILNIRVVTFDTDGVTVPKGTNIVETATHLNIENRVVPDRLLGKLERLSQHVLLNFSSGRTVIHLDRMYGRLPITRTILQGENGLFTLYEGHLRQHHRYTFTEMEAVGNMRRALRDLAERDERVKGFEPKHFLITLHCHEEVEDVPLIKKFFDTYNLFYLLWNGEAYDIGIRGVDKGSGLLSLAKSLNIDPSQVIAIGNGPNDEEMVHAAGIGITTDPNDCDATWRTEKGLELGGEELVDKLLELYEK